MRSAPVPLGRRVHRCHGSAAAAPPPAFGTIASKEPRIHSGNMDNKELGAGSTLYLPVWVHGANFSVGDGHGVQGVRP